MLTSLSPRTICQKAAKVSTYTHREVTHSAEVICAEMEEDSHLDARHKIEEAMSQYILYICSLR
jgi:hypothetical protein